MVAGSRNFRLRQTFAARVREERKLWGLSQEGPAEKSGLHRTYIGSVERGERNVSIDNIERIAKALDVKPADLLVGGGKGIPIPTKKNSKIFFRTYGNCRNSQSGTASETFFRTMEANCCRSLLQPA